MYLHPPPERSWCRTHGPWRRHRATSSLFRRGYPRLSETRQPMTQTAHVPARGPATDVPRKPARLGSELRPYTLPASTTPLYGAIDDGLIPSLKIREPRRRIALDTTITLCAEHTPQPAIGSQISPPGPRLSHKRLAYARRLRLARPRCGVRMCADLGCSPPTLEGHHAMTDRRRTSETDFTANRWQRRAIQRIGRSAHPRRPAVVRRKPNPAGFPARPATGVPVASLAREEL